MIAKYAKYWRKSGLKEKGAGDFLLNHIREKRPKNFLEIGVFHGVTSRNICELLHSIHGKNFKFTGVDIFSNNRENLNEEYAPNLKFSNPLKRIYYKYIIRTDPYSLQSVLNLLKKFRNNVNIIKGDSNKVLKDLNLEKFDYVFLDGGHKFETVKSDLEHLTKVISNGGIVVCDDYNLFQAPGVKAAIEEYILEKNFNLKILFSRFAEISKK